MTKTKNKKNIILLSLLSVIMVLCSFFAVLGFKKENVVKADSAVVNFYGSSFYVPFNADYLDIDYTWNANSFGMNIEGGYIWTYGNNIYYSRSSNSQYIYNQNTSTFTAYDFGSYSSYIHGNMIYSGVFGNTICFTNSTNTSDYLYIFNGFTFDRYVLSNTSDFTLGLVLSGFVVNNTVYFCKDGVNKVLVYDNSTYSLQDFTFSGLNNIDGAQVWSCGDNIYYSNGSTQYVLDTQTMTWTHKDWNGRTNFYGSEIWNYNLNYFYSNGSTQYVLDIETNTWSLMSWNGLSDFHGMYIWNDTNNYYISNNSFQYSLSTAKSYVHDTSHIYFASINFSFISTGFDSCNIYLNAFVYTYDTNQSVRYAVSNKLVNIENGNVRNNIDKIYDNSYYIDYMSFVSGQSSCNYLVPFEMFNSKNIRLTGCFIFTLQSSSVFENGLNFDNVSFSSTASVNQLVNYIKYTNNSQEYISFAFPLFLNGSDVVYYYGDSADVLTHYLYSDTGYNFGFNSRTYYLASTDSSLYQQGYQSGLTQGYQNGYNSGYNQGTQDVSQSQYNAGYDYGYSQGVLEANNYSFVGLISAVIDVPIKAFTSLFNFDLLGVNMLSFVTALFTLAVIITIIKKVV